MKRALANGEKRENTVLLRGGHGRRRTLSLIGRAVRNRSAGRSISKNLSSHRVCRGRTMKDFGQGLLFLFEAQHAARQACRRLVDRQGKASCPTRFCRQLCTPISGIG